MRFHLLFALALVAAGARASSVSNEVHVNSTQPTETNPRSGSIGDSLNASFDATENFTLNVGGTLTSQNSSPSPRPAEQPSPGVSLLNFGVDWLPSDNWTLSLTGEWSPQSKTFADAPIASVGIAHIRSETSEVGGGLEVAYDTAGESNLEWSFSGGLTLTDYGIDQTIPLVTNPAGQPLTPAQVRTAVASACAKRANRTNCQRRVLLGLTATPFHLNSLEFSASATATLQTNTDLTLAIDYYSYFQDATQAVYASLIFNGRGGAGVPVAPLQFNVRPEVTHRIGAFSAKAWIQAGKYVAGVGDTTAGVGVKLQYKFSKAFKLWVSLLGSRDVDDQGNETRSGSFGLGAGYRF